MSDLFAQMSGFNADRRPFWDQVEILAAFTAKDMTDCENGVKTPDPPLPGGHLRPVMSKKQQHGRPDLELFLLEDSLLVFF